MAAVLDIGSRKIVGWTVAPTLEDTLVESAFRDAWLRYRPAPGLLAHSDRGSQYTSALYQTLLLDHGVVCSISRKGNCWDNACVESFFSTLKRELPNDAAFEDWQDVDRSVFAYVETFYNSKRCHSALDYLTPNEYVLSTLHNSVH